MVSILYVVSEDWYFLSHRLPMARAARAAGFEVHVATKVTDGGAAISREGFILHPIPFTRGRIAPFATLSTIAALRRVYHVVQPAIVHHVSLQSAVVGSLAALGRPTVSINALTGLGFTFTSRSMLATLLRPILRTMFRFLFGRKRAIALVQNPDDRAMLVALGISPDRIVLIAGSGVDAERLQTLPEPVGAPTIAFVGRLLEYKGVRTLVEAHRLLRVQGRDVELLIAGTPDTANPATITVDEVASWNREAGVHWLGHIGDVSAIWARAHIAVLPSRGGEGLPLSLLEAAACGRAMIATDVPGSREIVIDDLTGQLVPVGDVPALAAAIARLSDSVDLRNQYGQSARRLVEQKFSADIVGRKIVELYLQVADVDAHKAVL